jgi:Tfp pilus assembly protein PilF
MTSAVSSPNASPRPGFGWPLALFSAAAAAVVYINALHNPFVYDDHRLILENDSLSALPDIYAVVVHEWTRPLVNLTYAIDWTFWGLNPVGYHLTNVGLHLVNVMLVFAVTWLLAVDVSARVPRTPTTAPNLVAAASALIFAVHPMMTQAVGYVSGRSELLCATFGLLTLVMARQFRADSRRFWAVGAVAAWLLAALSKEVAVVVPLLLLAYDRWLAPTSPVPLRTRVAWLYLPIGGMAIVGAAARVWVFTAVEYGPSEFDAAFILVQIEAFWRYGLLLLGRGPQSIFHWIHPYDTVNARMLLTLVSVPLAGTVVSVLFRVHRLAAYGAMWLVLSLLPSSALFVLGRGEAMAEHRAYFASIGFFVTVGVGVERAAALIARQRIATRTLAAIVAMVMVAQLAMHTVFRNTTWSTPISLWQDAVDQAPGHWLPHLMLGEAFREAGRCPDAIPEYRVAIAGNPDEPLGYSHLGSCLISVNELQGASGVFNALNARHPGSAESAAGLGLIAVTESRWDDAHAHLTEALRRDNRRHAVRQLLTSLEGRHDPAQATLLCQQIALIAPRSKAASDCGALRDVGRP